MHMLQFIELIRLVCLHLLYSCDLLSRAKPPTEQMYRLGVVRIEWYHVNRCLFECIILFRFTVLTTDDC